MKRILLLLLMIYSLGSVGQAPLWQWIKINGSYGSINTNGFRESTRQIGSDAFGNLYGVSFISSFGRFVDTLYEPNGMGYDDFCVFSYRCDGTFRWVKFFGSNNDDRPCGIVVSPTGDVFVTGGVVVGPFGNAHFGDSIVYQNSTYSKFSFIAKLDSIGNTQWLNLPGPNFNFDQHHFVATEFDASGQPVVLVWFGVSAQWNGFTMSQPGHYLLTFDSQTGMLIKANRLGFIYPDPMLRNIKVSFDHENNLYAAWQIAGDCILGNDTVFFPNTTGASSSLLVKFDSTGQKIWHQVVGGVSSLAPNPNPYQLITGKPVVYNDNIYIAGETQSHPNSNFLGVAIYNPIAYSGTLYSKVIAKFNKTSGAFGGAKNFWHNNYISNPLVFVYNDQIYMAGGGGRLTILNQTDTLLPFTNDSRAHPFIVQIDTGLTHFNWGIGTKILTGNTMAEMTACTIDNNGNIILGGSISGSVVNSFGDTSLIIGGDTDFFVAKIATNNSNCGCKPADPKPQMVSLFNKVLTVNGNTTIGADSLAWFWGDGTSTSYAQPGATVSHTYQQGGNYTVCLRAWNICGVSDSCFQVLNVGVNELVIQNPELVIYPNPFKEALNIELPENMSDAQITLYDLVGEQVLDMNLPGNNHPKTVVLDSSTLEPGIYVIHLVSRDGGRFVGKVVKKG